MSARRRMRFACEMDAAVANSVAVGVNQLPMANEILQIRKKKLTARAVRVLARRGTLFSDKMVTSEE